ncbi:MAG: LacI family transcriptional regulator [Lachnospiraceae bacterium]|nr:LacI family transcriptional regulator [Lachnospiraceae bacterium]
MFKRSLAIMLTIIFGLMMIGCGSSDKDGGAPSDTVKEEVKENIVVGFSQLGAESDWRSAHTESIINTFTEENGYELIFEDGQQKQANQIMAIRTFIQQEVDYIILAPVTEKGWDTVLQEAKDADIPVIIVDRMVDVADESLFTCWVGADFELEGQKVTEWLRQYTLKNNIAAKDVHIVNIQGTLGGSSQIGRTKRLRDAVEAYGWDLLEEKPGDFTRTKGKEVMEEFLKQYDNINVVYCENDNEAYGAIEAIEATGKKVGLDIGNGEIMVVSFDGVKRDAMSYALKGKIACIAECNPLHGPRVQAIIETLETGEQPVKFHYMDEEIFSAYESIDVLKIDEKEYSVVHLTQEIIEQRYQ